MQCTENEPTVWQRSCTSLWLGSLPKPARMGGVSGYIMRAIAIGSSDFFSFSDDYKIFALRDLKPSLREFLYSLRSRLAYFSENNTTPCALPLFSSQGPERKKQRGKEFALGDQWVYAGCAPMCLTLSP